MIGDALTLACIASGMVMALLTVVNKKALAKTDVVVDSDVPKVP